MTERRQRSHTYRVWKDGQVVSARFEGSDAFRAPKIYPCIAKERVFAVDTESLTLAGRLSTLLIPLGFHDWGELLETPAGLGMLERFLDTVVERYGEKYKEAHSKQRSRAERRARTGKRDGRDGRRISVDPVVAVFFNLPYDFGRLSADRRDVLRSVAAGADSYRIRVSPRIELEVVRMHFGSGSSFEWFVRRDASDPKTRRIARVIGLDMAGYWKTSLAEAAKSVGVVEKLEIDPALYSKPREAFTEAEWTEFKRYALGDVETTLALYHATVDLLVQIDARVVRRTGVIPPSAPGASARIVFARAFDRPAYTDEEGREHPALPGCHPGLEEWPRYAAAADQMGLDAYFGGRSFNVVRGVRSRMVSLDLKSAYPYALSLLPDPVTVRARPVVSSAERMRAFDAQGRPVKVSAVEYYHGLESEDWDEEAPFVVDGSFDLDDWRGRFGVLYIDGESLDDLYPPFRVHSTRKGDSGRLRYVAGRFENRAITIPEICVGVVSGRLRVDRIRRGVVLEGSPDRSFIRAGIIEFFRIKESDAPKPLRDMAKLLANSLYGKLIEIQSTDYGLAESFPVPRFARKSLIKPTIAKINAEKGPPVESLSSAYWGETPEQQRTARAYYAQCASKLDVERDDEDRGGLAVLDYVTALRRAGVPLEKTVDGVDNASPIGLSDYLEKTYRCGYYFFPLYAAQVTGLVSAMLGQMARELGALQGDTDSVHFELPRSVKPRDVETLPGVARYFEIMTEAGYPSPHHVGSRIVDAIPGAPKLGTWELETPEPSVESVLVRPKVYSHEFEKSDPKTGSRHKQAQHGFARFGATRADLGTAFDHLAKMLRATTRGAFREAKAEQHTLLSFLRAAEAENLVTAKEPTKGARSEALHDAFRTLVTSGSVVYQGRAAPRKLREAMAHGREIGEFNSRVFEALLVEDPNTFRDVEGRTRWKQAASATPHKPMAEPVRPVFPKRKTRRKSA